jgi:hypothetical protein
MLIVAGTRIRREHVLGLAKLLVHNGSDRTARKLIEAITNAQEFVALTVDDRERILSVLDHPPAGLVELRHVLFDELNWRRDGLVSHHYGARRFK